MSTFQSELQRIIEYHNSLLPESCRQSRTDLDTIVAKTISACESGSYDFSKFTTLHLRQNGHKRTVQQYGDWSTELFLCIYLKRCIDRTFKIRYPNRNDHMHTLFGTVRAIQDMKDFVVIKFDFKDFFNSISSEYVYQKFLVGSNLNREQKNLLCLFVKECPYCYAGINTSNVMAEVVSREFDQLLTNTLLEKGLIFYKRYVDDGIIIFNKYISQNELLALIDSAIKKSFYDPSIQVKNICHTALNTSKFAYLSKRDIDLAPTTVFDFSYLGYLFLLQSNNTPSRKRTSIKYGITKEKINKYSLKLDDLLAEYIADSNIELLRHKIRAFCCRTVYRRKRYSCMVWKVKGFASNYNELRFHLSQLEPTTELFLKNGVKDAFLRATLPLPYFLKDTAVNSPYNLYGCLNSNNTLLFEENERIGITKATLEKMCQQLNIPTTSKTYNALVREYLIKLRVGH